MRAAAILSLAALAALGSPALAQDSGQLRGVYGPVQSWPTAPGRSGAGKGAKPTLTNPDPGPLDGGPVATVPGTVRRGTVLPGDIHPAPIAGRPGYGAAIVNGERVIVDMSTNTVFQSPD